MKEVVVVSFARTPVGAFQGKLTPLSAAKLGAIAIKEAVKRAGISGDQVDEVLMGNVLMGGQGQAPARQAALYAELPETVRCQTVNKVCGSGLRTMYSAAQTIMAGDADVIIAGGLESMTNAPYAMLKARGGFRMGNGQVIDLMVNDGLWDPYTNCHMGNFADKCAKEKNFPREAMDEFAAESYRKAQKGQAEGWFKDEIVPVEIPQRKGDPLVVDTDEGPAMVKFEKIPKLRPAFNKDGAVTAANASSINDGAAAVVMMSAQKAQELGIKPIAKVVSYAEHANPPEWFTTAPAGAIKKALAKAGLTKDDVDIWEINEAFSCVTMYAIRELGLNTDDVNVAGGAVALGHPIGASGARLAITGMNQARRLGKKRLCISLCIGGGEGNAMILDIL